MQITIQIMLLIIDNILINFFIARKHNILVSIFNLGDGFQR